MPAHSLAAWVGLAFAGVLGGCSSHSDPAPATTPTPSESYQPLVLLSDWSSVSRDDDPFVTDAGAPPPCVGPGFVVERDTNWLEVDTGLCSWVTLKASAHSGVSQGQQLRLTVSHYDLNAGAPAEADLALRFEDCDAWSTTIPIPSAANVDRQQFASPCALNEGAAVLFHLNNHGQNTYQLQDLSSLR
jgi:hypothetical protein